MAGDDVPEVGDKASWNWNGAQPGGEVAEKKSEGEIAIQSKRGNTIKKSAQPDDPAIHLARPGNDVVKNQSELQVDAKTSKEKEGDDNAEEGKKEDKPAETNGTKRKAEDKAPEETEAKKAKGKGKGGAEKKANSAPAADGEKKRGRPKGQGAKKEKKPPAPPTGIGKRTRSQK